MSNIEEQLHLVALVTQVQEVLLPLNQKWAQISERERDVSSHTKLGQDLSESRCKRGYSRTLYA